MEKAITLLKDIHPYKISQLNGKDNRWQTYVTENGHKKQIKGNTKNEVYEKLLSFYCVGENDYTVNSFFDNVWIKEKGESTRKSETINIRINTFEKYVRHSFIGNMKIAQVTNIDLEKWANKMILDNNLNTHQWNDYKTPVKGIFWQAYRRGLIKKNPWDTMEIDRTLLRSQRKKESKYQIFYYDEISDIIKEFECSYEKTRNTANLALIINFELGLRVGELVALKYNDFDFSSKTVRIERQESDGVVEEYVKKDSPCGYRTLQISDKAINYARLAFLQSNGEYLFCKDNKRLNTRQVARRLENVQKKLKYEYIRETHCIRRTVASKMNADGIPIDEIRRWLGHTTTDTTLKYLYNIYRDDEVGELHRQNSILAQLA